MNGHEWCTVCDNQPPNCGTDIPTHFHEGDTEQYHFPAKRTRHLAPLNLTPVAIPEGPIERVRATLEVSAPDGPGESMSVKINGTEVAHHIRAFRITGDRYGLEASVELRVDSLTFEGQTALEILQNTIEANEQRSP